MIDVNYINFSKRKFVKIILKCYSNNYAHLYNCYIEDEIFAMVFGVGQCLTSFL